MQAAVAETLKRLVRREKLIYVTASGGRAADTRLLDSVGMYVRTVPFAVESETAPDALSEDFIMDVYGQMKQSLTSELYPYTEMVATHDIKAEIMFTFQMSSRILFWSLRIIQRKVSQMVRFLLSLAVFGMISENPQWIKPF